MSLLFPPKFQHMLRFMNTNIDGQRKVPYALTSVKVCSPFLLFKCFALLIN